MVQFFNIKIESFYCLIKENEFYQEIVQQQKFQRKKEINYVLANRESALLALVYSFLKFKKNDFLEDKLERRRLLRKFWTDLMTFLKNFNSNQHPFIKIWILDIFYMCAKKYPVQEIINEYSIFRTLHDFENGLIE